jgi:hypothetical protein
VDPLCEVVFGVRLHAEERSAHIDHLPGEEKREPSETDESGRPGAENKFTPIVEGIIASPAKIPVSKTEDYQRESTQTECTRPEPVYVHIEKDFPGEDSHFQLHLLGWWHTRKIRRAVDGSLYLRWRLPFRDPWRGNLM